PNRQDTYKAHGEPLGEEEVRLAKRAYGWPEDPPFYVPDEALQAFREAVGQGEALEVAWKRRLDAYRAAHPDLAEELLSILAGKLPAEWETRLPSFSATDKPLATREASGTILNAMAAIIPNLMGGSADLDPSTHTLLKGQGDFERPLDGDGSGGDGGGGPKAQGSAGGTWGYAGRSLHFGVREHAMGAILTGMALHGGPIPFGGTFLTFSDYMRPSVRLAALSEAP